MSYILDALRKSDQQRQRGTAPTLLTAQATVPAPTRPGFSLNGWLVAALVGAGILVGWLRPWQTEPAPPMPEPIAARPLSTTPALPAHQPDLPDAATLAPEQKPGQASISAARLTSVLEPVAKKPELTPPAERGTRLSPSATVTGVSRGEEPRDARVAVHGQTATPVPENAVVTGPTEAERSKNVMPLSELPPSIRQEIPNITISFHVYSSNPAERRIMINNELLRQGESAAPGLKVEQITPDGVVIGYKGYRFQRGVR